MHFTAFETVALGEALGAPDLPWATDGVRTWQRVAMPRPNGDPCIAISAVAGDYCSWLAAEVEGSGILSFWWW